VYLVINLGLKSIRFIIFNNQGAQVYFSSRSVQTFLHNDFVEQDANDWEKLFYELFDELSKTQNIISQITCITVTTSSCCILGIDENFRPVTKAMMVSDKRSQKHVRILADLEEFRKLELICSSAYGLPKILWQKENNPDFEKVIFWLNVGDYLALLLTGKIFTDQLNASKFLFHPGQGYPKILCSKLGFSPRSLPEVKPIGYTIEISNSLRKKYKFNNNCFFILSTYDAICAVIGSGSNIQQNVCDVSGTVTSVRMFVEKPKNSSRYLQYQTIDLIKKNMVGASNNLGGGLIEWLKQAFYNEDVIEDVYYQMEYDAIKSKIGAAGIIFLPYLLGEREPFSSSNIKGEFIGISRNTVRSDFTRAVFESTAYITRDLLSAIKEYNPTSLSVSGGLARFDIINQIKADVTNLPVNVLENFESTSMGAFLICQTVITGVPYEELCNKFVHIRKTIYPNESNHKIYDDIFSFFIKYRNIIMPIYEEHSVICANLEGYKLKSLKNL
jgi:xylulokinase